MTSRPCQRTLLALLVALPGWAFAGVVEGPVVRMTISNARENSVLTSRAVVIIEIDGTHQNPPGCVSGAALRQFVVDLTTDRGRAMLSNAQLAFALGRLVIIKGKDSEGGTADCSLYTSRETAAELDVR